MAAVEEGDHTHLADDIDGCVSQIDYLGEWHVVNFYTVILIRHHRVVVSEIGHQVEPYSLSLVDILSSTCSVRQRQR